MLFLSLVAMKELLARAEEKGVAIGAFSVGNMEMVMGAVKAAEELETPIILQIAEVRLKKLAFGIDGADGCLLRQRMPMSILRCTLTTD
mgnify:CR=1 FL=1